MMCAQPFVRAGNQKIQKAYLVNKDNRLACTPFPCGQCLPCRINRRRVWEHRLLLEKKCWEKSCFTTLTYSDKEIGDVEPCECGKKSCSKCNWAVYYNEKEERDMLKPWSLYPRHLTLFFKKLRKYLDWKRFKYYAVGEYGSRKTKNLRPHYHVAFFGLGKESKGMMELAWDKGFVDVGDLNKYSAKYIAGYITEGVNVKRNEQLCRLGKRPEYATMSNGIGLGFIRSVAKKLIENDYFEVRRVLELNHGKSRFPLGRYLIEKLADEIGVDKKEIEEQFFEYQQEIFNEVKGDFYVKQFVDNYDQNRLNQAKRYKIYNRRNKAL